MGDRICVTYAADQSEDEAAGQEESEEGGAGGLAKTEETSVVYCGSVKDLPRRSRSSWSQSYWDSIEVLNAARRVLRVSFSWFVWRKQDSLRETALTLSLTIHCLSFLFHFVYTSPLRLAVLCSR